MCTSIINQEKDVSETSVDVLKKFAKKILKRLIIQIHVIFDWLVDFFFGLLYCDDGKKVPPVKNPILLLSACELAERIRTRQLTSVEVVNTYIERAKEVHTLINAIVEERFVEAKNEAKDVDKFLEENKKNINTIKQEKPFLGVPFTTKESIQVKGMLHTMGIINRRNFRSEEDATAVSLLKQAGAILIAKTNVPELNLWTETRNNVYGQTCNPYNTTRNVGGSSGGEGAIIAACGAAFSLASDIGGSTRMPAFFNGVFGYKPTEGVTPMKGIGLREEDYFDTMASVGPICKKAEDLVPILEVLAAKRIDTFQVFAPEKIKNINVFYQEYSGDLRASQICAEMKSAFLCVIEHLQELTGSAIKIKIPGSEYSYRLWRYWMTQENFDFKLELTNRKYRANAATEITKLLTGKSEITLAAILKLCDEDWLPKEDSKWARNVTEKMDKYLSNKLGNNGVLLYPSSPFPAGYHYSAYLRPFNFGYWCIFNVLRYPCCQVPLGLDKNGLPIGIQVVSARGSDYLCLAVARQLEKQFGGWVPPS